jgi:hypothetical protein
MRVRRRVVSLMAGVAPASPAVTVIVAVAVAVAVAGCASVPAPTAPRSGTSRSPSAAATATATAHAISPLPAGVKIDYQLGGSYSPPTGVRIVTRDSTDSPASGLYNICYINGFQTQGYQKSFWLRTHPTLVLRDTRHRPVSDPGWPGEMLLDSSTAIKRKGIAAVMAATTATCANNGFDAVEYDNLDSYSRSHGSLTKNDNIALAKLLVTSAHSDGLAAGQKNAVELAASGRDTIGFDFAVAEECNRYDECGAYTKIYGARVIDIEYTDDLRGTFASVCAAPGQPPMTILRDRDLTSPATPATPATKHYTYESC